MTLDARSTVYKWSTHWIYMEHPALHRIWKSAILYFNLMRGLFPDPDVRLLHLTVDLAVRSVSESVPIGRLSSESSRTND